MNYMSICSSRKPKKEKEEEAIFERMLNGNFLELMKDHPFSQMCWHMPVILATE
jgi:hypothetical protein